METEEEKLYYEYRDAIEDAYFHRQHRDSSLPRLDKQLFATCVQYVHENANKGLRTVQQLIDDTAARAINTIRDREKKVPEDDLAALLSRVVITPPEDPMMDALRRTARAMTRRRCRLG
jgi:hypothetical protein